MTKQYIPNKKKILTSYKNMFGFIKEQLDEQYNDLNELDRRFRLDMEYLKENLK